MPEEVIFRVEELAGDGPEGIQLEYENMIDNLETEDKKDGINEESNGDMSHDDEEYNPDENSIEDGDDERSNHRERQIQTGRKGSFLLRLWQRLP